MPTFTSNSPKQSNQSRRKSGDPQFGARCGAKAVRPSERARVSQFKPGDKIKVSAKDGELVFQKKQLTHQGVKPKAKIIADFLAAIRERRA